MVYCRVNIVHLDILMSKICYFFYHETGFVKAAFHDTDTDTDILARILVDTSDTRDSWSYSCGKLNGEVA